MSYEQVQLTSIIFPSIFLVSNFAKSIFLMSKLSFVEFKAGWLRTQDGKVLQTQDGTILRVLE